MKIGVISAALLALTIVSVPAAASGSGSGSRGGGGFGGASGASSASRDADRLLRRGRSQVRRRITCKECEYRDRLNDQTAAEVAQAVRNGQFEIKDRDRTAVLAYLRDRYGV